MDEGEVEIFHRASVVESVTAYFNGWSFKVDGYSYAFHMKGDVSLFPGQRVEIRITGYPRKSVDDAESGR